MLMRSHLRLCLLSFLGFLLPACATSGGGSDVIRPRPGATAAEYYPLTDGWKWAYDVEHDGTNILATYVVLQVKGKVSVVQAGDERLSYLVAPDGIAQFEGTAIGDYVIKDPIKPGSE
jgi:hypothetical protein